MTLQERAKEAASALLPCYIDVLAGVEDNVSPEDQKIARTLRAILDGKLVPEEEIVPIVEQGCCPVNSSDAMECVALDLRTGRLRRCNFYGGGKCAMWEDVDENSEHLAGFSTDGSYGIEDEDDKDIRWV